MEEIGCHFKLENINGNHYHNTNLLLSSGRNCLRYIIKERSIKTIFLPYFLCESLSEVSLSEKIQVKYYHVDDNLVQIGIDKSELNENTYLYIVNYYGLLRDKINTLIDKYKYVIIDNTHDFFNKNHYEADVIYNYRKYFGVPDGACIVSNDLIMNPNYSKGTSLEKIIEMVARDEKGEFLHYPTFLEADKHFKNEDLRYMSNFTQNYLKAINYNEIKKKRLENFRVLVTLLSKYNELNLNGLELSYMYPLLVSNGSNLRDYLKGNNIYAIKLWPNVMWNGSYINEQKNAENMVLLPIDQRYSDCEMEYIAKIVDSYYSNAKCKIKTL